MDKKIEGVILSTALAITVILSSFVFSLTEIKLSNFNTLNVVPLTQLILSANFVIFLLISAVPISIILITTKRFLDEKNSFINTVILTEAGFIIGAIIGTILFNLTDFLVPVLFVCIGIPVGIKLLEAREKELKAFVSFRAGTETAGKIVLFASIGFFIYLLIINSANSKEYEANFTSDLISATVGDQGNLKEQIATAQIESTVQSQQALLNQLRNTPQFGALAEKTDTDVIAYVTMIDAINQQINSQAYKDLLKSEMEKELAKNAGAGDMTSAIENALPLKKIAPYAWLIYSLMGFFLTLFLTGLITTNLVGAYYTIVSSIISKKTIKTNPQTEQNQNS
ncbi:MAG: hypothetical protein WC308_02250 [archaeon]|jgi:hypothetical protein